jgi:hypothetical protein
MVRARRVLLSILGTALLVSCGDSNAPPDPNLRVSVTTAGVDLDPDGYVVRTAEFEYVVAADDSRTFYRSLSPGTHRVRLEGLAPNCDPVSATEMDVLIQEGQLAAVEFAVECRAILGFLRVRTITSGRDYPLVFPVSITAAPEIQYSSTVPPTGTQLIGLRPDTYYVSLALPSNCQAPGPAIQAATVTNGQLVTDTATVDFAVDCTATTGDIRVVVSTTGPNQDFIGYPVWLDGVQQVEASLFYYSYYDVPVLIPVDGERYLLLQAPGEHTVELRSLPAPCSIQGSAARVVTVSVGASVEARFDVDCPDVP